MFESITDPYLRYQVIKEDRREITTDTIRRSESVKWSVLADAQKQWLEYVASLAATQAQSGYAHNYIICGLGQTQAAERYGGYGDSVFGWR